LFVLWYHSHLCDISWLRVKYLYCSHIIRLINTRNMIWVGQVVRMRDIRGAFRILMWRPVRKRTLGIPKPRWEDSKMEGWWVAWTWFISMRIGTDNRTS
jgi:hypothetical protein